MEIIYVKPHKRRVYRGKMFTPIVFEKYIEGYFKKHPWVDPEQVMRILRMPPIQIAKCWAFAKAAHGCLNNFGSKELSFVEKRSNIALCTGEHFHEWFKKFDFEEWLETPIGKLWLKFRGF